MVNPLVVILFNVILPISLMIPGNPYENIFFLVFASIVLFFMKKYKRLLKFLIVYALFTSVFKLLSGTDSLGQFISVLLIMTSNYMPCFMMASVLVLDYTPSEIISALEPLHLPKGFVVALSIVIRYIPTFKREFSMIKESMRLRGVPYSIKYPIKSFQFFLVPQLFRCAALADEITSAGLIKGITNPKRRTSYYDIHLKSYDYFLCGVLVIALGVFIIWR